MAAISIRIDDETKRGFDEFCESVGLSVSTAFNLFAKTVVREQRIPFEIRIDSPNTQLLQAFRETEEIVNNPNYKGYTDVDSMMDDILGSTED